MLYLHQVRRLLPDPPAFSTTSCHQYYCCVSRPQFKVQCYSTAIVFIYLGGSETRIEHEAEKISQLGKTPKSTVDISWNVSKAGSLEEKKIKKSSITQTKLFYFVFSFIFPSNYINNYVRGSLADPSSKILIFLDLFVKHSRLEKESWCNNRSASN